MENLLFLKDFLSQFGRKSSFLNDKKRNYQIDNAKFILIFLVVLGHLLESFHDFSLLVDIRRIIYVFHMPLFVFLSGTMSTTIFDQKAGQKWLATLVIPYLVFQALHIFMLSDNALYQITKPRWTLWFLVSLATWRLTLPAIMACKYPIFITLIIALLAGCVKDIGFTFSLSRTCYFLPFFVAGYVFKEQILTPQNFTPPQHKRKIIAVSVLVLIFVIAFLAENMNIHWLYGDQNYFKLHKTNVRGICYRLILIFLMALSCWAIWQFIPKRKMFFTRFGANSLSIYLMHSLYILFLDNSVIFILFKGVSSEESPFLILIILIGVALIITVAFGSNALNKILKPVVNYSWLWDLSKYYQKIKAVS